MPFPSQVGCSRRSGYQEEGLCPWSVDKVKQRLSSCCVLREPRSSRGPGYRYWAVLHQESPCLQPCCLEMGQLL